MRVLARSGNVLKFGLESAVAVALTAKDVGRYAVGFVSEICEGKQLDRPHIVQRIEAEIAVTNANAGRQLVTIADKLEKDAEATREQGHSLIVKAALEANKNPETPEGVFEDVANIAVDAGTDPLRLQAEELSRHELQQARHIIERHKTN